MELTLSLAALVAVFLLSAWGWGRLLRPLLDRRLFRLQALTAILGLAVLNALGGLLNWAHLATRPVVLALCAGGCIIAIHQLWRIKPRIRLRLDLRQLPLWTALVATLLLCHLLAPAGVFNIHDDFHTYATRAVRMAQTGSVGGNPFDPLGLDSLGSQSFFHAFFIQGHDLRRLNGFDAIACFGLCLWLIAELCRRWRLPWWVGITAVLALVSINPQCVNVSPLYSGTAAILALITCGGLWARTLIANRAGPTWRIGTAIALLISWLITLKITLAAFGVLYLGVLGLLLLLRAPQRIRVLKSFAQTAVVALLLVLPWVLVTLPTLLQARAIRDGLPITTPLPASHASISERNMAALFQPGPLWYGNTTVVYLALALAGAALAALGLLRFTQGPRTLPRVPLASAVAAGAALLPLLLLHAHLFPIASAVRYTCPILIGGFFGAGLCFLRFSAGLATPCRAHFAIALAACQVLFIGAFAATTSIRLERANGYHSLLAYPLNRYFIEYSRAMTSAVETEYAARIQAHVPSRATTLVWAVAPFHFDFTRNRLLTLSESGVVNPALGFPAGADLDQLTRYLQRLGVRSVVLETNAYGIKELDELATLSRSRHPVERKLGDYGAYLRTSLTALAARYPVKFADERMVIFELPEAPPQSVGKKPFPLSPSCFATTESAGWGEGSRERGIPSGQSAGIP